jgi:hypothetical protein
MLTVKGYVRPKHRFLKEPHDIASQKTALSVVSWCLPVPFNSGEFYDRMMQAH